VTEHGKLPPPQPPDQNWTAQMPSAVHSEQRAAGHGPADLLSSQIGEVSQQDLVVRTTAGAC